MSTWNELGHIWQACFTEAVEAYLHHNAYPIGSVVVNDKGEVVSKGRSDFAKNRLHHAETDAMWKLPKGVKRLESEIYSLEPCPMCTGAIRMAQLRAVHFAASDPGAGCTDFLSANEFMRQFPCKVNKPSNKILEFVLVTLLLERRTRMNQTLWREHWYAYQPKATELGEKLATSNAFDSWKQAKLSVSDIYEEVSKQAPAFD